MAIRFTPEYNKRIAKVVKNYNASVRKANKQGKMRKDRLPELTSVETLKKSYSKRADLERELKTLESFSRKSAKAGYAVGISNYDIDVIRKNRRATIKHFEHVAETIKKKATTNYPLQTARYKAIEANLKILKKRPSEATEEELKTMLANVTKYRKNFERQATGYRGFMSEIDLIMERVGISDTERDAFFEKFSKLTPEEFEDLYSKNDLISRIYELADSPKYTKNELHLYASEDQAKNLINTLMNEADMLIAEVKQ